MIESERGGLRLLVSPALDALGAGSFRCAISTRPLDVRQREGRDRFATAAGFDSERIASVCQVHHATILRVDAPTPDPLAEADGLVTDRPGLPLFLRAADCSLVVVADPVHHAVGAAHAGWKGSARGIVVQLMRALTQHYGTRPEECAALVGPTIGVDRFPVGPEVAAAFRRSRGWTGRCIQVRGERLHFDLALANALFLEECGIPEAAIERSGLCTFDSPDLLHSYRRDGAGGGHHGVVVGYLPRETDESERRNSSSKASSNS